MNEAIVYSVRYGAYKANPKKINWTVFDDVVADGVIESVRYRWFIFSNDIRVEVPMDSMVFSFSAERQKSIHKANGIEENYGE